MNRWIPLSIAALLATFAAADHAPAQTAGTGHGEELFNTRLVGTNDLQARSAYQPLPVRQGARRIAYVGHHAGERLNPLTGAVEPNGTSVVDVTDPAAPVYLAHIPATGGASGAQMVQTCAGDRLPGGDAGRFYLLRSNGNRSHEVWDVTDPARPAFVRTVAEMGRTPTGEQHTHKNWWECDTGVAYLVGTVDGWRAPRILQIFDLADPAAPRRIRDFSLPGVQPDASGPIPGRLGRARGGPAGEPRLPGVRHLQQRRGADPRPRPAAERQSGRRGPARGQPRRARLPADRPHRPAVVLGRPHRHAAARRRDRRLRRQPRPRHRATSCSSSPNRSPTPARRRVTSRSCSTSRTRPIPCRLGPSRWRKPAAASAAGAAASARMPRSGPWSRLSTGS